MMCHPPSIHSIRGTMACAVTDRSSFRRVVLRIVMILSLCHPVACFQYTLTSVLRRTQPRHAKIVPYSFASACRPLSSSSSSSQETESSETASASAKAESPWTGPELQERMKARKSNARFRQHVNPLSRTYQTPAVLSDDWPASVYTDLSKPLHLDIGCGKGGFLLDMAAKDSSYNYLGLEIRPMVAQYARDRIKVHNLGGGLDYIGCNANVDLQRILERYHAALADNSGPQLQLQRVSIQFPDPHFKTARHGKRRVVKPELVASLAAFMPPDATLFLQSDIQIVLDDMRARFRESPTYFRDSSDDVSSYLPDNIIGVPTERELSVLKQDLPVYRAYFTRTVEPYATEESESS